MAEGYDGIAEYYQSCCYAECLGFGEEGPIERPAQDLGENDVEDPDNRKIDIQDFMKFPRAQTDDLTLSRIMADTEGQDWNSRVDGDVTFEGQPGATVGTASDTVPSLMT